MSIPASLLIQSRLAALHREGFVLLRGVLAPEDIAWARDAIDQLTPTGLDYQGLLDDHYKCVFNRDPRWPWCRLGQRCNRLEVLQRRAVLIRQ